MDHVPEACGALGPEESPELGELHGVLDANKSSMTRNNNVGPAVAACDLFNRRE